MISVMFNMVSIRRIVFENWYNYIPEKVPDNYFWQGVPRDIYQTCAGHDNRNYEAEL